MRADLDDLLTVVSEVAVRSLAHSTDPVDLDHLTSTPLPTLATELTEAEVPSPTRWLFEVVETVSEVSASWGFVLAGSYIGQRIGLPGNGVVTGRPADSRWQAAAVPSSFVRDQCGVVVLDPEQRLLCQLTEPVRDGDQPTRSGLRAAELVKITGHPGRAPAAEARSAYAELCLLHGAVCTGIAKHALREAVSYANVREQFGAAIATFSGLRAILGQHQTQLQQCRVALCDLAADPVTDMTVTAASNAADMALDASVAALQVFGGYGYIDEYPVAALVRDAISMRARIAPASIAWRNGAAAAFRGWGR